MAVLLLWITPIGESTSGLTRKLTLDTNPHQCYSECMQLMTKEIEKSLPALYSTEKVPTRDKKCVVKYFTPWSNWTWYVVEGSKEDGDWLFFGLVDGLNGNGAISPFLSLNQSKARSA
jgi:hypothetical protein